MTSELEDRVIRLLLSGLLASSLSDAELKRVSVALRRSNRFRIGVATRLAANIDAILGAQVATPLRVQRTHPWTPALLEKHSARILKEIERKGLSNTQVLSTLRKNAPSEWSPGRRTSTNDLVRGFLRATDPDAARRVVDSLREEQVPLDPFLSAMLGRDER